MIHKPEIVISTCPGTDHMIERLIGSTDEKLQPGNRLTQIELERMERARKFKITLVRRKV